MTAVDSMEVIGVTGGCYLTEADQKWLTGFGVDPSWQEDPDQVRALNYDIEIGSRCLKGVIDRVAFDEVVSARERFLVFSGVGSRVIEKLREMSPAIVPTDTFIATQRILTAHDLDGAKIATVQPSILKLGTRALEARIQNLSRLGFDTSRVVNAHPTVIGLNEGSIAKKVDNLTSLGLDAVKIGNTIPSVLGFAIESSVERLENLTMLGLDAAKVVNKYPQAMSFAPESVESKLRFLRRSAKLLGWQHTAEELVESYPGILGFSIKKLQIMRRIAAENVNTKARSTAPDFLRSRLITPLENYLLVLNEIDAEADGASVDINTLVNSAARVKLGSQERRSQAIELARVGALGRVGAMYLDYVN